MINKPPGQNVEDIFPLSPLQAGMLFHTVYEPELGVYFNQLSLRMRGDLDESAFEQAWQRVAERHAILRTAFVWEGLKQPQQVVFRRVQIGPRRQDWRHLGATEQEAALEDYLRQDRRTGFDLSVAPLMRLSLIRLEEQSYEFTWSFHHILLDGWSLSSLMQEVVRCYEALRRGERWEEAERRPYRDYIEWLQQQDMDGAERFWRQRLQGFRTPTRLTGRRMRAERLQAGEDYGERERSLGKRLTERLKGAGQRQQVTMNTLVQGAWSLLLSRYSGEEDVMFGGTVSGRPPQLAGVENMLGLFINTLPVRVGVVGEERLWKWLGELQRQQAEVRQYEYSPLMKVQGWSEVAAGEAMFETLLVFENYPLEKAAATGSELEAGGLRSYERTNYALSLAAIPGEELRLRAYYDRNRWEEAGIERLLAHVENILGEMVEGEQRRLREVELLTEAERRQLLEEWNETDTEYPHHRCIHEVFEEQAGRRPDAVAVVWEGQYLSYAELNRRANQLARALRGRQVKPEVRVGICMERSAEMVIGLLGILKACGAYVPLDAEYPLERLAMMMEDSGLAVLLTQQERMKQLPTFWGPILNLDSDWSVIAEQSAENLNSESGAENAAYVMYTSGSTGGPKGVEVLHRGVLRLVLGGGGYAELGGSRHVLQMAPVGFDASTFELWGALLHGGRLVLYPESIPTTEQLGEVLERESIDTLWLTASLFNTIVEDAAEVLSGVRQILVGGEALSAVHVEQGQKKLPGTKLINGYGPTESTTFSCCYEIERGREWSREGVVPIGRPIGNTEIYVLDRYLEPVPVGGVGELYIGGDGLARGYLNRAELTAEKFVPHPYSKEPGERLYRTGDIARYRADGNLEFVGRMDEQVKVRGYRIEPGEIESVLRQHPGVTDAVVVAQEVEGGHKRLVGYVTGEETDDQELRRYLQGKLPEYMVPTVFVHLEHWPLNANGKLDRRALPSPDLEPSGEWLPPSTPEEEILAGIWAQVLDLERVGRDANFFELGGHSLLATQVISRVRRIFRVELPLRSLFENPSLAGLAGQIAEQRQDATISPAPPIEPVEHRGPMPLSFAQQRLWFLDQMEPGSAAYIIPTAMRLSGALKTEALQQAFNDVVSRHEALRTNFLTVEGHAVQVIHRTREVEFAQVDLSAIAESEREQEVERLLTEEARRPFDLGRGPLLRTLLLRLGAEEHILLLTMHHIVSDGWSMGVLLRELVALYEERSGGRTAGLPKLPIQYADYAHWQRQWLRGEELERQLSFWKQQLADISILSLPTSRAHSAPHRHQGAVHHLELSAELTRALRVLSNSQGVSVFMMLTAAVQTLLYRYTGQHRIAIGSPVAIRNRLEVETLIGFFVNDVVLCADFGDNPRFRDLLTRARKVVLDAYAHQELPFEKLVEHLIPDRILSQNPLFQVAIAFQNAPPKAMEAPGLILTPIGIHNKSAKFDLTFIIAETGSGMHVSLEYKTELYEPETVSRLIRHFEILLQRIVADPSVRISEYELLSKSEQQLLSEWSRPRDKKGLKERCIHEVFELRAREAPDSIAIVFEDQHVSYRTLNERANQLAHHLLKMKIGAESHIGICVRRSAEMVAGLLGILKAGAAYVPMDPAYVQEQAAFTFTDARIQVLVTEQKLVDKIPSYGIPIVSLDTDRQRIAQESAVNPVSEAGPESLAYLTYTSGSTGQPKASQIPHRSIIGIMCDVEYAEFDGSQTFLQYSSVSWDALTLELWGSLLNGAKCILSSGSVLTPADISNAIQLSGVSVLWLTSSLFNTLIDLDTGVFSGIRHLLIGGEVLSAAHVNRALEAFPGVQIVNGYGPSECTVFACCYPIPRQADSSVQSIPIGKPVGDRQIYVLDRYLQPVPVGAAGELCIGGDGLARGYLNRPELTAEKFVPHPFSKQPGDRLYRTGDIARYRSDGNLEFVGRIDEQVKVRGYRIEPGEIESVLRQHPGVRDAVVMAQKTEGGHKRLVGYVVGRSDTGEEMDGHELRRYLQGKLPEYMVPTAFVRMEQWPLNANGKLDRRVLPVPETSGAWREGTPELPTAGVEQVLAEIWSQVLGVENIGRHDNFFELGGDSILSIQIVARAHRAGLNLSPAQLFRHQSIAQLAAVAGQRSALAAEQGVVTGEVELTPVQRWFLEEYRGRHDYFNQAVMLQSERRLKAAWVREAVDALMRQHDALRLRFDRNEDGSRRQWNAGTDVEVPFAEVDYSGYEAAEQRGAVEAYAARMQSSLDLRQGPLLRAVLFDLGAEQAQRLLLVVHHLAVDGVSWRILLEDWQKAYEQLSRGERVELGAKSSSYQEWGRRLAEYGRQSEELRRELGYWTREREEGGRLPRDREGENTVESAGRVVAGLDEEQTEALLEQVPAVYRTRIQEVLLTALARSAARWTGKGGLWVEMEGHGREAVVEGLDVSRTVGWFTSVYPLWLEWDRGESVGEALKGIKEQMRALPKQGIGYGILRYSSGEEAIAQELRGVGQAEINFNYLGQFDGVLGEESGWRPAVESCGPGQEMSGRRQHVLQISGHVAGGRMEFSFGYSENLHRRATIEAWAAQFVGELHGIIAHCQSPEAGGYTPSDFAIAGLRQAELDALLGQNRNIEDLYPLSPLQEGMLFHTVYESELGVYFNQLSLRMNGNLDEAAFEQAWQSVVDRHGILRTAFVWEGLKQPQQVVYRRVQVVFHRQDWRHLRTAEREAALEAYLRQDRRTEFDLSVAPLMRLSLIRLEEQAYEFTWSFHHILLDGWSLSPLMREVVRCYEALRRGERWEEAERRPYRDYIEWLQQQDMDGAEHFWRQRLQGFYTPTRITAGKKRAEKLQGGEDYGERERSLGKRLTERLKGAGQRQQVTMNTLVQGAWSLLLSRYSGEEDVMFGATVSGRPPQLTGVENILGLFINTLPVRVEVVGEERLGKWLEELQRQQAEVRQYEFSPLTKVRGWSEVAAGEAMFETLLVFENYPLEKAAETGSELDVGGLRRYETANYALSLAAIPGDDLRLRAYYDRNRWEDAAIERMLIHVENLLAGMASGEQRRLREVDLLTEAERRQLLVEWNDTRREYSEHCGIHEVFEEQAEQRPDAIAVVWEGQYLSYGELNRRANRLAGHLRQWGVGAEVRVGICVERSAEMVIGLLGILKAGGTYVPLDAEYPLERLAMMMEDSGLAVLLTQQGRMKQLPTFWSPVLNLDSDWPAIAEQSAENLSSESGAENAAYVMYTSGSTGGPKGVEVLHRGVLRLVLGGGFAEFGSDLHVLQMAPVGFDASTFELWGALLHGGRLVLYPESIPTTEQLGEVLERESIDTLWLTASLFNTIVEDAAEVLSGVRQILVGGEALSAVHVEQGQKKLPGTKLINGYGPTESTTFSCCYEIERGREWSREGVVPIGRPIGNTEVYVLDRYSEPVPVGGVGELYIGGDGLARGYLNRAELTAEKFVPHPYSKEPGERLYRTGDIARYRADGNLEFVGRMDEQVKVRGYRIEPGEIESVLRQHPGVRDAVVVASVGNGGSRKLVAYVIPDDKEARPAAGCRLYTLPNELEIAYINKSEADFVYEEIFEDEIYLRNGIAVSDGDCVFDVGANIGLFTLFVKQKYRNIHTYAFEPLPPTFDVLKANVSLYGLDTKLFNCGLSNISARAKFVFYPGMTVMSGKYADASEDQSTTRLYMRSRDKTLGHYADQILEGRYETESYECDLKTLSGIILENEIEKIDLLKIDVEKSELDVLEGIEEKDWPKIKQIVIEVHDGNGRLKRVMDTLLMYGFQVSATQGKWLESTGLYIVYATRGDKKEIREGVAEGLRLRRKTVSISSQELRGYLRGKLPEYMVPTVFVHLEQWPLNANGKLDRRALPVPEASGSGQERELELPATDAERMLAEIWSQVLGVENIGRHDNFFELGGDSILSIQIVARAHRAGLNLSPAQLFRHPSIAQLAAVAGQRSTLPAEQGVVSGEVELTPVQRWFLEEYQGRHDHFNQAVMLQLERRLEARWVKESVRALMRQHDALRLRFERAEYGSWRQWNAGVEAEEDVPFTEVDYSGYEAAEQRAAVEAYAARMQSSLDLMRGPLLRAVLFELGAGRAQRLLLVVHHLAVDGVSWRILLEDWQKAYEQMSCGERVGLGAKSSSYQEWGRKLAEYGKQSEELRQELDYWTREREEGGRLPRDREGENTVESAGRVVAGLEAEQTEALLEQVPAVYRTRIQEVLLTALARSAARWTGKGGVWVEMEGHGREAVVEGLDLSRTVGWFTSLYPLWLEVDRGESIGEALKAIKEQVRGLPKQGIGYGILRYLSGEEAIARRLREAARPEISFNYLGQFDGVLGEGSGWSGWSLAPESCGPGQEMSGQRQHVLQITGHVVGGRMEFSFGYSENLHRKSTIEGWAEEFVVELRGIIAHCQSPEAGGYTPSDFAMAGLTQAELDALLGQNRNIEDMYPLSPLQEGMLFHTVYESELGVYFNQLSVRMRGELDEEAFEQAWNRVVDRHGILRTAFVWEGLKQPQQVVYRRVQIGLLRQDWRHLGTVAQETELGAYLRQDRRTGFDLSVAPLMRLSLIRLEEQAYEFTWSFHHILLDGWSLSSLMREVVRCYEALRRGERWEEGERRPYRDYIEWLQQQDMDGAERFWRQRLRGFRTPTRLRDGRKRGERLQAGEDYGERERGVGKRLTEKLKGAGQRQQVTMNTLVQGAWSLLLSRYSGEEDVMFGGTVSGRPPQLAGVENMLGLFINTLPVRVGVVGEGRLGKWLEELQRQQAEVRQYEYSPLMKVQGWSEVAAGEAMFETLLVFENYPLEKAVETGSELEAGGLRSYERTNYALSLAAIPGDDLRLRAYYDRNRWEDAAIERLLIHVENILAGMAEGEQRRLREVELLTEAERRQLLAEWNDTETEYPENRCIHELFEEQAGQRPDAVAVVWEGQYLSYGELNRRANQLAHALRERQVKPEVRVGICMERSPEMVIGLLGILKAGGAYVPLDAEYPQERLAFMLADALVSMVLTQTQMKHLFENRDSRNYEAEVILLQEEWSVIAREDHGNPSHIACAGNIAYAIYTSGSAGRPKGVLVPHRALCSLAKAQIQAFGLQSSDRILQFASLSFDASVWEMIQAFTIGATLCLVKDPGAKLIETVSEQAITIATIPPSLLAAVAGDTVAGLHTVITGGEVCPLAAVRGWARGRRFFNVYGPTETTCVATLVECVDSDKDDPPIGYPIANVQVYVLDRYLEPAPLGGVGELYIGGNGLARGYLNRAELTAERFVPHPYSKEPGERLYRTGDIARYRADGNLEFVGRIDEQVKVRGYRIEPGEIESVLRGHPEVQDAVVTAQEGEAGNKRLVGYVVSRGEAGKGMDSQELRRYLRGKLPEYMVPTVFVWVEQWPLNVNGKLDRRALPVPEGSGQEGELELPATDAERMLAEIWSQVLGVPTIGRHDNFFALGGDSILSIQIVARAHDAGLNLSPAQLFRHQSIAQLAAVAGQRSTLSAEQGVVSGEVELTPVQRWFLEEYQGRHDHFNQAVMLQLERRLEARWVKESVRALMRQHDALRLRFERAEYGSWRQWNAGVEAEEDVPFTEVDYSGYEAAEQRAAVEAYAARMQSSLDLMRGPLLRAVLFELGAGRAQRLLLVVHHLAVDGVSWRILLEDWQKAYEQMSCGERVGLGAKSSSYQEWGRKLAEYGKQSEELRQELDYWTREREEGGRLPRDREGENTVESAGRVVAGLEAEQTEALLEQVPAVYRTRIQEVLLTALARSAARWTGKGGVWVEMEGHGREAVVEGLDLSRTVGWFTSLYPLWLEVDRGESIGEALKAIKEQVRGLPKQGIGYGILRYLSGEEAIARRLREAARPEISFNYLGQFDGVLGEGSGWSGWSLAPESCGPGQEMSGQRQHVLQITGHVVGGRMEFSFGYSENLHRRATIEGWAEEFVGELRGIIAHCQSPSAGAYTPSDFPYARISNEGLKQVMKKVGKKMTVGKANVHK